MSYPMGSITIMYQDSNLLLFHVDRAGYTPMQHLFRIDGMYTIVSEREKNSMIWKFWSLYDNTLYWSFEEITSVDQLPNIFGSEYYDVVSSWIAETVLLRDKI